MTPSAATPKSPPAIDAGWTVLLLLAAGSAVAFLWLVAQRLPYPHELEWMEGAMADHAHRIASGQALYCAPTPEHVPFLYAPLLFWLAGGLQALGVPELLALRGISAACSLGIALLVGHWVRVHTGRFRPGLVASGVFVAGYGWLWWWYDLARNDSLFLLLILATAYALQHAGRGRLLVAALLATAALLAKQSAAMWLPAIGVGALCLDWRLGWRFCVLGATLCAGAIGALHWQSDGWSTFYLFDMPRHHGVEGSRKLGFWTEDVLPMLPLLLLGLGGFLAAVRRDPRGALFLAAVGSGGLLTSWASRLHVGGFDNVLIYAFAAACVLGPAAVQTRARWLEWLTPGLLAVQFVVLFGLAWHRHPEITALPSPAHRAAHEQLQDFLQKVDGDVFLPGHGAVTRRAGKPASAHGQAIFDLLQVLPRLPNGNLDLGVLVDEARLGTLPPRAAAALRSFRDGVVQGLASQRFGALVLDQQLAASFEALFAFGIAGADAKFGTADDLYTRRAAPLLENGKALNPLVGFEVHSPYALEAVGKR